MPNPEIRAFDIGDTTLPEAGFIGSLDLFLLHTAILDVGNACIYIAPPQPPPSSK